MPNRSDMEPAERLRRTAMCIAFYHRPLDSSDYKPAPGYSPSALQNASGYTMNCECCWCIGPFPMTREVLIHRTTPGRSAPYSYKVCDECFEILEGLRGSN
jgi:hypothetical protein